MARLAERASPSVMTRDRLLRATSYSFVSMHPWQSWRGGGCGAMVWQIRDGGERAPTLRLVLAVLQDLHALNGHEAARHHAVEHRQEGVDLVLGIDDLDHHRQLLRQPQD